MNSATATVIDLEAYRARKRERETAPANTPPQLPALVPSMGWMPVWIVPVFYMVGAMPAGAASG
jgi:hypothetical protein